MDHVSCRFCRSRSGTLVVDLGDQPASELFPPAGDAGPDPRRALRLWLCDGCGLAQLADRTVVPEDPQGTQPDALTRQFEEAVAFLDEVGLWRAGMTVREFPSPHRGSWLPLLARRGMVETPDGPADVVVDSCFGVMHEPDQRAAFAERLAAVRPGGTFVMQFASLVGMVEAGEWNAIRHGHYAYYSLPAVREMLGASGFVAVRARWFDLYGGTVLVAARRDGVPHTEVEILTDKDRQAGALDPAAVATLQHAVGTGADRLRAWLVAERAAGRRVYGYCAASRAVALLNRAGIDRTLLAGIADVSPGKQGSRIPGTDIPVIGPRDLVAAEPSAVLLFVPDLLPEVRAALPEIGRWITPGELVLATR